MPFSERVIRSTKSVSGPLKPEQQPLRVQGNVHDQRAENVRRGWGEDVVIQIDSVGVVGETELSSHPPSPEKRRKPDRNGFGNQVWRDTSHDFDFSGDANMAPPFSQSSPGHLPRIDETPVYGELTPKGVRDSLNEFGSAIKTRFNPSSSEGEAATSSASSSYRRKSNALLTRMKSRLMDRPPEVMDQRSQNQKKAKSAMVGKGGEYEDLRSQNQKKAKSAVMAWGSEYEEDDPFLDEDLPEEYKKAKLSKISLLQLLSLIMIIATLSCTLAIPRFRKKSLFELKIWKWELMVLVLISGRLISGWFIRLVVFFIECSFLLRKRVLYFVYGVKSAVQSCLWLAMVLISWHWIFNKEVKRLTSTKVLNTVTRIWVALLVSTVIWLLKTLLINVLASSFHVKTFFDRIQESLFNQYLIETLSGPPSVQNQLEEEEEEKLMAEVMKFQNAGATLPPDLRDILFPRRDIVIGSGRMSGRSQRSSVSISTPKRIDVEGVSIDHLHRLNQKNVSAWNMKKLTKIVKNGILSTLDEQTHDLTDHDMRAVEITSECQAKAAAKKIFYNVASGGSIRIYLEDLMKFLREDEARKTMSLFEGESERKGISKRALKTWVVNVFRERRALALSLDDTAAAVNKLHHMLNVAVAVMTLIISLLILKITSGNFFIVLGSQLLLVGFMFGNTCKTTFESIIFLFVMHPYDVGDRCEIDGVQMVVEEMNILTTVFLRFDNQKIIYPNSVLATKPISNYYRSPDMGDAIDFCIHVSTPMEKISLMRQKMIRYVDNTSDHWYSEPKVVLRDVEDMNRLNVSLWVSHRMNFQDMGERWVRRGTLLEEMIRILRGLDIEYRMLPVDVNVRNMPAVVDSARFPSNWNATTNFLKGRAD